MIETPLQTATRLPGSQYATFASTLRGDFPSPWSLFTSFPAAFWLTIYLAPLALLLVWVARRIRMQSECPASPFRFMDLPPELRDMVYEYLLEDPQYPPPPPCTKHNTSPLGYLLPRSSQRHVSKKSNWILLANKQTYAEYMDILVKKTTFHLTVSPSNCPKSIGTISPTSSPTSISSPANMNRRIWNISPSTLKKVRKCDLKLITTSSMLGVPDPRNMPPASWELAAQIKSELQHMSHVKETTLHIKAIGDPLWNPLWVWYHASQSFCSSGSPTSPTSPSSPPLSTSASGPRLSKITFSLDTWSPGENYLARTPAANDKWGWYCTKGHCVSPTNNETMTVREFCAKLYMECRICRPELESDDEVDDEDVDGFGDVDE